MPYSELTLNPSAFGLAAHSSCHDGSSAQGLRQDDALPCLHSALAHQAALLCHACHAEACAAHTLDRHAEACAIHIWTDMLQRERHTFGLQMHTG